MEKNRVTIKICGVDYFITTEDSPEYAKQLAKELDDGMNELIEKNPCLSITQVAILNALSVLDNYHKEVQSAENLRSQISEYLDDAAEARSESAVFRREIERLHREVQELRDALAAKDDGKKA